MEEIKNTLRELLKDSLYAKTGILEQRIEQLINIHKSWIIFAQYKLNPQEIANKLYNYEKNLNKVLVV
jgi:precorrin-6B methylase 1